MFATYENDFNYYEIAKLNYKNWKIIFIFNELEKF